MTTDRTITQGQLDAYVTLTRATARFLTCKEPGFCSSCREGLEDALGEVDPDAMDAAETEREAADNDDEA